MTTDAQRGDFDAAVPDPVPAAARDTWRDQLAAHRLTTPRQCLCGERQEGEWSDTWHADHVHDLVLVAAQREAAAEALERWGRTFRVVSKAALSRQRRLMGAEVAQLLIDEGAALRAGGE